MKSITMKRITGWYVLVGTAAVLLFQGILVSTALSRLAFLTVDLFLILLVTVAVMRLIAVEKRARLRIAALEKEIQRERMINPLTDLYTRESFFRMGGNYLQLAKRYERPLTLCLLEIDQLTEIHDRWGLEAGEHIVREVARVFKKNIRDSDILGDYRGNQLLVLCPDTDREGTCQAIDKIRRIIASLDFPYRNETLSITLSGGLAAWQEGEYDNLRDMVNAAHLALIAAGKEGPDTLQFVHSN